MKEITSPSFLATHHFFEVRNILSSQLNDLELCKKVLYALAEKAQVQPLDCSAVQFNPQGCSVVLILAESHTTIHTWPEHGVALIDLFSCSPNTKRAPLETLLMEFFPKAEIECSSYQRGKNQTL